MEDVIIGIDPDVGKSGVAIMSPNLEMLCLPLWDVFALVSSGNVKAVYVEAGWMNKSGLPFKAGIKRAVDMGRNHSIGQQIVKYCIARNIDVVAVRPSRSKVNHKTFVSITGYQGVTNQEKRDAAMLIWGIT